MLQSNELTEQNSMKKSNRSQFSFFNFNKLEKLVTFLQFGCCEVCVGRGLCLLSNDIADCGYNISLIYAI